jgi:hypothetical protein
MKTLRNIFSLLIVLSASTTPTFAADNNLIKGVPNDYVLYGALGTVVLVLVAAILSLSVILYLNAPQLLKGSK